MTIKIRYIVFAFALLMLTPCVISWVFDSARNVQVLEHGSVKFSMTIEEDGDAWDYPQCWCLISDKYSGYSDKYWIGSNHRERHQFRLIHDEEHNAFMIEMRSRPGYIILVYQPGNGVLWPSNDKQRTLNAEEIVAIKNKSILGLSYKLRWLNDP